MRVEHVDRLSTLSGKANQVRFRVQDIRENLKWIRKNEINRLDVEMRTKAVQSYAIRFEKAALTALIGQIEKILTDQIEIEQNLLDQIAEEIQDLLRDDAGETPAVPGGKSSR